MLLNLEKHITLPGTLKNNTLYLVKNGSAFDLFATNGSGTAVTYPIRNSLLTGNAGGQSIIGGTASGEGLTLVSTAHSSKGKIYFGAAQTSVFDEVNNRLGILTAAPTHSLTFGSTGNGIALYNTADQTTNYERIRLYVSGNVFYLTSENGGTGTLRSININGAIFTSSGSLGANTINQASFGPINITNNSGGGTNQPVNITGSSVVAALGNGYFLVKDSSGITKFAIDQNGYLGTNILPTNVSTTDATQTTLQTIAIATTKTVKIDAVIVARCTGGTSGTVGNAASYKISRCYKNVSGTVSMAGGVNDETNEDVAAWDATAVISGTNVLLRVTGAAATNIMWQLAEIKVYSV